MRTKFSPAVDLRVKPKLLIKGQFQSLVSNGFSGRWLIIALIEVIKWWELRRVKPAPRESHESVGLAWGVRPADCHNYCCEIGVTVDVSPRYIYKKFIMSKWYQVGTVVVSLNRASPLTYQMCVCVRSFTQLDSNHQSHRFFIYTFIFIIVVLTIRKIVNKYVVWTFDCLTSSLQPSIQATHSLIKSQYKK